MARCLLLFLGALLSNLFVYAQVVKLDHCSCLDGGVPSDSTFTVRGRMLGYCGNPTYRIWPIGTRRLLGIRGVCVDELGLGEWTPYLDYELWADFTLSALTPQRPGVMQFVCIRAIAHPLLKPKQH